MALAAALEVSPIALLMPSTTHGDETTATAVGEVTAHRFWNWWLTGEMPLTGDAPSAVFGFISRSVPDWLLGTDYKLVEAGLSPRKEYSVRRPDKVLNRGDQQWRRLRYRTSVGGTRYMVPHTPAHTNEKAWLHHQTSRRSVRQHR